MSTKRSKSVSSTEMGSNSCEQSYMDLGQTKVKIVKMGYKTQYCVYRNVTNGYMMQAGSTIGKSEMD